MTQALISALTLIFVLLLKYEIAAEPELVSSFNENYDTFFQTEYYPTRYKMTNTGSLVKLLDTVPCRNCRDVSDIRN